MSQLKGSKAILGYTEAGSVEKLLITFDGNCTESGLASAISWNNSETIKSLRSLFHCKDNERIVSIKMDKLGMTAYLETKG